MLNVASSKEWHEFMRSHSRVFEKYGSFMPVQTELLETLYCYLHQPQKQVLSLSAPPASGKTHVISLVAHYLHDIGVKACIVVPNAELHSDFAEQNGNVKFKNHPPILSLAKYLKRTSDFDVAIVDEAHNLRSAYELNQDLVKTFAIEKDNQYFDAISTPYLKNKSFAAVSLNLQGCSDIVGLLAKIPKFKKESVIVRKHLTRWIGFLIATEQECKVKFMYADPSRRSLLPKIALILFSATPLENRELHFYCNIPNDSVQSCAMQPNSSTKGKIAFLAESNEKVAFEDKISTAIAILKKAERKSLILLNNSEACQKWFSYVNHVIPAGRVFSIGSGVDINKRKKIYVDFRGQQKGILLTSSSVFWEGITIKDLQLLIIPDLPYPEPHILDILNDNRASYVLTIKRRLIQGMGRIGRNPNDRSLGLLLFKPPKMPNMRSVDKQEFQNEAEKLLAEIG